MNYEIFVEELVVRLKNALAGTMSVGLTKLMKNNNVQVDALVIGCESHKLCPTLYPRQFFLSYTNGSSMEAVVGEILSIIGEYASKQDFDFTIFERYDAAKKYLSFRILNYGQNQELLSSLPHRPFLDMAIVYCLVLEDENFGAGSVLIHEEQAKRWLVTEEELYRDAVCNAPILMPHRICSMSQVMRELAQVQSPEDAEACAEGLESIEWAPPSALHVLTNARCNYGAACMLYPGVLSAFAAEKKSSFYILPSSIHEVLLLVPIGEISVAQLRAMVTSINRDQVSPLERLSDQVYHYDWITEKLDMA